MTHGKVIRGIVFILIVILGIIAVIRIADGETELEKVWVLCQPDSFVNIRESPGRHGIEAGYAECGDMFWTDGKKKNGYLHVYASVEAGEGWISTGYIVWSEPEHIFETRHIESKGRVNARKTIGGKRRCWLKNGTEIKVYWIAEWAVTNKGFIKSDYIGIE